jgi:hypothetical protein
LSHRETHAKQTSQSETRNLTAQCQHIGACHAFDLVCNVTNLAGIQSRVTIGVVNAVWRKRQNVSSLM